MTDSVPAPMVQIPAEAVEKLREAYNHRTAFAANVISAARALLDAADTPRDQPHDCDSGGEDGYCSNCDPALASTSPAAPPERCLACLHPFDGHEGLTCAEMEAKHGVVQPEPLCRCGHDKAAHEYEYSPVKGHCSHGGTNGVPECRCARFTARVPVSDEAPPPDPDEMCPNCVTPWKCNGPHLMPPPVSAEEAWQAWIVETRSDRKVFIDSYDKAAFLAGWQAAKEDDRGN